MSTLDTELTTSELAVLANVTERRIRQLCQEGKLRRSARNKFRLGDAVPALFADVESRNDPEAIQAERLRKLRAEATMAELELAKQRGAVALVDEFKAAQASTAALIRVNLLQVPTRAVLQLLNESSETRFKQVLRAEIVLALQQAKTAIESRNAEDIINQEDPQDE